MRAAWLATLAMAAAGVAQAPPTPGPEHEILKKQLGSWECAISGGGGESKGTMKFEAGAGGLWIKSDFDGAFAGMKFQGHGLDTYDAAKKKYVSVWVDSMSTTPTIFEGTYDAGKKALTMVAVSGAAGPDGKPMAMTSVTTFVDDDHMTFVMKMGAPGGEQQEMMSIKYTRRK